MELTIRQENGNDTNAVFEVNTLAFGQMAEAKLVNLLRCSEAFVPELSIVATTGNEIVGHVLFTRIKIIHDDGSETESLALAPMAVKPGFQHKGIGTELIRTGLNKAKELHYKSVIVQGHSSYYPKFGFVPAAKWNIRSPYNVPASVFMALELEAGALDSICGMVKYPAEFDVL